MDSNDERILKLFTVKEMTGLSKSSIYAMEAAGKFPNRVSIGPRSVGWKRSEVLAWINTRQKVVGAK
jgi:prophage regulatory protein